MKSSQSCQKWSMETKGHVSSTAPHPVMPLTTSTWLCSSNPRIFSLSCQAGRFFLCSSIDLKRRDDCIRGQNRKRGEGSEVVTDTHRVAAACEGPSPTCFLANSRQSLPFSCSTLSTLAPCLPTVLFLRLT